MIDNMEKRKIGLFIPYLAKGGAGRAVSRISILLSEDFDVHLILFTAKVIDFEYSGKIIDLDLDSEKESLIKKIWRTKKRITALKKIKNMYNLDLVISFLEIANICNIFSKSKKCKVIVSVRGSIFSNKADGITASIKSRILSRLYKRADCIIAVSKLLRQNIIDRCRVNQEKVVTIYNPYNLNSIAKQASEELDEDMLAYTKGHKVVLAAGQLVFQKGFWHLIKAFKLAETANTRLLICGEGHQRNQLTKLIADLKLSENVKLIGFQKNVFKYMKMADVFVLPSITEGFPNVLVEAMACETPIIAADCASGPREILVEKPNIMDIAQDIEQVDYGILVPRMSTTQNWNADFAEDCEIKLAKAIDILLGSEPLRLRYSKLAFDRAKEFTNEACADKYKKVINEMFNRSST